MEPMILSAREVVLNLTLIATVVTGLLLVLICTWGVRSGHTGTQGQGDV